jgi:hypothetical protein
MDDDACRLVSLKKTVLQQQVSQPPSLLLVEGLRLCADR